MQKTCHISTLSAVYTSFSGNVLYCIEIGRGVMVRHICELKTLFFLFFFIFSLFCLFDLKEVI